MKDNSKVDGDCEVPKQAENILLVANCSCHEFGLVSILVNVVISLCNLNKCQSNTHFNFSEMESGLTTALLFSKCLRK